MNEWIDITDYSLDDLRKEVNGNAFEIKHKDGFIIKYEAGDYFDDIINYTHCRIIKNKGKDTIKIEGLPDGIEATQVIVIECETSDSEQIIYNAQVIARRIKPRRVVLEDTGRKGYPENGEYGLNANGSFYKSVNWESSDVFPILREVKEDEETQLSLSVDECKSLLGLVEMFSKTFGCRDELVSACNKMRAFIKDK